MKNKIIFSLLIGIIHCISALGQVQVGGSSSPIYYNSNKVGIGTSKPAYTFDVNGTMKANGIYLQPNTAINSLYNKSYILRDHNNGNVTVNAAGESLYLGYKSTKRVILSTGLYDKTGKYSILTSDGRINQGLYGATNYLAGHLRFELQPKGSSSGIIFRGENSDYSFIFCEQPDTLSSQSRMVFEVRDDTNDYIQFRHKVWNTKEPTALMDLTLSNTLIYKPLGLGCKAKAGHQLTVNGSIIAKEIVLTNSGTDWPDYVFSDQYNLLPLSQLEQYIQEENHLPGIPSAETVAENGHSVTELNKKLLEKIEELTLYTIEQEKKLEKQDDLLRQFSSQLTELKQQVAGYRKP